MDRYADNLLEGISGMGSQYAEEDYRNYLQYLKTVLPDELSAHQELYDEEMRLSKEDAADAESFDEK